MADAYSASLNHEEAAVRAALAALAPAVAFVAARYGADVDRIVAAQRRAEHAAHPEIGDDPGIAGAEPGAEPSDDATVTAADQPALLEFRRLWHRAVGLELTRRLATALRPAKSASG